MDFNLGLYQTREGKLSATLSLIESKIHAGSIAPEVFQLARAAVRGVRDHDEAGEIKAVARAIKDRVRFTRDPYQVEAVADAADTLRLGTGDCDDLAVLTGAALQSIGIPVKLEVVGMNKNPDHIFLTAKNRAGVYMPIDLARPDKMFFSPQPQWTIRQIVPVGFKGGSKFSPPALKDFHMGGESVQRKRFLRQVDRMGRAAKSARARVSGPNLAQLTDGSVGSWLSEGIEKIVGHDASKKLEKGTEKFVKNISANTKAAAPFVAAVPGMQSVSAGMMTGAVGVDTYYGGLELAEQTKKAKKLAMQQAAKARKLAKQQARGFAAASPAPSPAPAANNTLFLLGGIGLAAYLLTKKKKGRKHG